MNPGYDFGRRTWAGANVSGKPLDDNNRRYLTFSSYKTYYISLYIYYFSQYRSLLSLNKPPPGIAYILSVRLVVAAVVVYRIISTHAVDHNQPTRVQSRASHSESKVGCK